MNPWVLQMISEGRRRDLLRDAQQRAGRAKATRDGRRRPSLDVKLGWAFIRVGLRLIGDDARGNAVPSRPSPAVKTAH